MGSLVTSGGCVVERQLGCIVACCDGLFGLKLAVLGAKWLNDRDCWFSLKGRLGAEMHCS